MYLIPPFAVEVVDVHSSSRTGSYSDQGSMHGQTCSTYNTSRTWTNHWKVVQDAVVWVTFPRENKCTQTMKRYWIIKEGLCMWMAAPPLPSLTRPKVRLVNNQLSGLSPWTISVNHFYLFFIFVWASLTWFRLEFMRGSWRSELPSAIISLFFQFLSSNRFQNEPK